MRSGIKLVLDFEKKKKIEKHLSEVVGRDVKIKIIPPQSIMQKYAKHECSARFGSYKRICV